MNNSIAYIIAGFIVILVVAVIFTIPILAIVYIIYKIATHKSKPHSHTTKQEPVWEKVILEDGSEFYELVKNPRAGQRTNWLPYIKHNLLTPTEYQFWQQLIEQCIPKCILVCPKVRMEDFLEVTSKDYKTREKYRGKVKSRHIDFILCDFQMNMLAGIELDDRSHNSSKAQELDAFKNEVFETIRIPLYRVKVGSSYHSNVSNILNALTTKSQPTTATPTQIVESKDTTLKPNIKEPTNSSPGRFSGGTID